ncbi:peptidylprolyl isomerase [Candidatus Sumerlaeota bacterium]|nr:peptidylprolyl isomerase [Candidatus Sumerlaeota bacterium]
MGFARSVRRLLPLAAAFAPCVAAWAQGPIRTGPRLEVSPRQADKSTPLAPRGTPIRIAIGGKTPVPLASVTTATETLATTASLRPAPAPAPLRIVEPLDPVKTTAALVGKEQLTVKEVLDQLALLRTSTFGGPTEQFERYRRFSAHQIIKDWIDTKMLAAEARARGLAVSADEVERYVQATAQDHGLAVSISTRLKMIGVTEEKFRAAIADGLLGDKLVRQVIHERITDDMIARAYADNPILQWAPPRRRVRQIVCLRAPGTTDNQMVRKMKAIRRRLVWFGGKFDDYANQEYVAQNIFVRDLGWIAVGDAVTPERQFICNVVFKIKPPKPPKPPEFDLKLGEISDVISSPFGVHIFQVVEDQPERKKTPEEYRTEVENNFFVQFREGLLKELEQKYNPVRDPNDYFSLAGLSAAGSALSPGAPRPSEVLSPPETPKLPSGPLPLVTSNPGATSPTRTLPRALP